MRIDRKHRFELIVHQFGIKFNPSQRIPGKNIVNIKEIFLLLAIYIQSFRYL